MSPNICEQIASPATSLNSTVAGIMDGSSTEIDHKLCAKQSMRMLEQYLSRGSRRPAGLFIPHFHEPSTAVRSDAIWMSHRTASISRYEIVLDDSELSSIITGHDQSSQWQEYSDYYWLVVSEDSLAEELTAAIPDSWGLCTLRANSEKHTMTVYREASLLAPSNKASVLSRLIHHQIQRDLNIQREIEQLQTRADQVVHAMKVRDRERIKAIRRNFNSREEKFREVENEFMRLNLEKRFTTNLERVPARIIAQAIMNTYEAEQLSRVAKENALSRIKNMERATEELKDSWQWKNLSAALLEMRND